MELEVDKGTSMEEFIESTGASLTKDGAINLSVGITKLLNWDSSDGYYSVSAEKGADTDGDSYAIYVTTDPDGARRAQLPVKNSIKRRLNIKTTLIEKFPDPQLGPLSATGVVVQNKPYIKLVFKRRKPSDSFKLA